MGTSVQQQLPGHREGHHSVRREGLVGWGTVLPRPVIKTRLALAAEELNFRTPGYPQNSEILESSTPLLRTWA